MPITTINKSLMPTNGNDRENDSHNTVDNPRDSSLAGGSRRKMRSSGRQTSRKQRGVLA